MPSYELLDFGHGRKLERFGPLVLDRPAPAAAGLPLGHPPRWASADARFDRDARGRGEWTVMGDPPATWHMERDPFVLELRRTASGAVGAFPEQAENWDWIGRQMRRGPGPLTVLNLFAYTGASTLAAAAAGAAVVHVDASRPVVNWARRNAELTGLATAPIRWIVEDARKFVEREVRRGRQYDAVILDPPTYGHGAQAEPWQLDRDLRALLSLCGRLTAASRAFMLLTCHTPAWGPAELEAVLSDAVLGQGAGGVVARALSLRTPDGRTLPSGAAARWPGG